MADLGKWITAAGGAVLWLFTVSGMVATLTAGGGNMGPRYGPSGAAMFSAVIEFLVLTAVAGAIVAGAVLMYERFAEALCWLAAAAVVLVLAQSEVWAGALRFYAALGGLVAVAGANWDKCCGLVRPSEEEGESGPIEQVPSVPPPGPPESRL